MDVKHKIDELREYNNNNNIYIAIISAIYARDVSIVLARVYVIII